MARSLADVREEAMQLSVEERSWLAEDLLSSLRSEEERKVAAEWVDVAERRLDEIEAGRARLVSSEEAIQRARAALTNARKSSPRG